MKELRVRAYIKPLKRYATGIDTIQFHKCCDVAGPGIWSVVTASEGIFEFDDIVIEQDTGLKDKNGKRIREGDIVKVDSDVLPLPFEHKTEASPVYYDNRETAFVYRTAYGGIPVGRHDTSIEVIGNIHENKELLGGKE